MIKVNHAAKTTTAALPPTGPQPVWEYYVDDNVDGKVNGWYPYAVNGAIEAEKLWVAYQSNNDMALRVFESGSFSYLVDLQNMTQQNVSLPNARKRSIRRSFNGISTQSSTIITSGKSAV
jgi:hypothetical protein